MLRRVVETGLRFVRRTINEGFFVGVRPTPSFQNAVIQNAIASQQPLVVNFRNFFFAHWLQNASRVARFKYNPLQRMVANRRNPTPMFLAFVGFTYFVGVKDNKTSGSPSCSEKEKQFPSWLQDMLRTTAENIPEEFVNHNGKKLKDYEIKERLGKPSSNSAVYAAEVDDNQCALKMLFNYDADSQSISLKKAFSKEFLVLTNNRETRKIKDTSIYTRLPNHFNVVKILGHFADNTPMLSDALDSYPAALPSSLYDGGFGHKRTMFFVMPKFSGTLQDYIAKHKGSLSTRISIALLAQLLESLLHLYNNRVAHRDLKSDNILVNESTDGLPHLVITDFGCCLAEKRLGLQLPYETDETSKGGNLELMPPEVVCAESGPGHKIDYSKSDEWAAGALAYEIFGQKHPFQNQNVRKDSYEVNELPELKGAPNSVQCLVKELLQRHPNDRPNISLAATVCQMLLWAPELCMVDNQRSCSLDVVKRWFEQMAFSLTLEIWKYQDQQDIPVEKQILLTFLCRTSVEEIMEAIKWLHNH